MDSQTPQLAKQVSMMISPFELVLVLVFALVLRFKALLHQRAMYFMCLRKVNYFQGNSI